MWRRLGGAAQAALGRVRRARGAQGEGAPVPAEAPALQACASVVLPAVAGGGLAGALWLRSHGPEPGARPEALDAASFGPPRRVSSALVAAACREGGARWRGATLYLRTDGAPPGAAAADRAATARLGGSLAAACEVVCLDAASAAALVGAPAAATGRGRVLALRAPPDEAAAEGPVLSLELRPGEGLLELYGRPSLYAVQDDSALRAGELAKEGRYSARDLFSGRPDRAVRALTALAELPEADGSARLQAFVGGALVPLQPQADGAGEAAPLPQALQALGLRGTRALLEACALLLQGEGAELLSALLRAQCGAAAGVRGAARDLQEVLAQHPGASRRACAAQAPEEALDAALARGFWTLPADESGARQREREAERLLERARRELWQEGSASRRELEAQIGHFLTRYALGAAAAEASLRLSFARAPASAADAEALRRNRFAPLRGAEGLWARAELLPLALPPAASAAQ